MRKLNIEDAFTFSEIIDKMGAEADLNKIFDEGKKKGAEYAGGQIFLIIAKKMHLAKPELIGFIASVSEKSEEEVKKMSFKELKKVVMDIIELEGFADFFKSALPTGQE